MCNHAYDIYLFPTRLTLPGRVVEDGRETAKYDVDKGKEEESTVEHFNFTGI